MNDPLLEKLNEMLRKLDASLTRLDALERLLNRMVELRRAIETGMPPPPAPSVN